MICPNRKVNETSISSRKEAFKRSPLEKEAEKPYFYTAKRSLCLLIKQDISKLAGHMVTILLTYKAAFPILPPHKNSYQEMGLKYHE